MEHYPDSPEGSGPLDEAGSETLAYIARSARMIIGEAPNFLGSKTVHEERAVCWYTGLYIRLQISSRSSKEACHAAG